MTTDRLMDNTRYYARYKFIDATFHEFKANVFEDRGSEIVIDKKKLIYLVRYYFDRIIPFCHDKMGCQNDTKVDRHKIISATTLCIMLYQPVSVSGDGDNNLQLQTIINAEFARFFGSYVVKLSWRKNSANNPNAPGNKIRDDALDKLWPEYIKYYCNTYGYMKEKTKIYSSGYLILNDTGYIYISIFPIAFLWNMIECCGDERTPLPG